jgi:transcriptional regulator GlxA family with amidase domain
LHDWSTGILQGISDFVRTREDWTTSSAVSSASEAKFQVSKAAELFTANLTVREAVREARMNRASSLLVDTNLTVREIGEACGFEYPHHFSRVFKQHAGHTPGAYRSLFHPS